MYKGQETVEIDRNEPLEPGSRVLLTFMTFGGTWITAANVAVIEKALERRTDWRIRSHSLPADQTVVFEVEVLKHNPVLITCAAIAGVIIAAGVVGFLLLHKTERIVTKTKETISTPAGSVATIGFTAIIGALVVWLIFRK